MYSKVSLLTLLAFPTSEAVLRASEREIAEKIASLRKSRSDKRAIEKAQKLREATLRNPFQNNLYQSHIFNLEMLVAGQGCGKTWPLCFGDVIPYKPTLEKY